MGLAGKSIYGAIDWSDPQAESLSASKSTSNSNQVGSDVEQPVPGTGRYRFKKGSPRS